MFLINIIEKQYKLSFETNYIDLWSFWGVLWGKNWSKKDQNKAKFTQNRTFPATYTPDKVIIWPHMACLPIFLSHTTYNSHISPHMGSNGPQIAVNRGFSCENPPCSRLKKIITRPFFDLEPCPIHQNDHIVHLYNLYNSDLPKSKKISLKITNKRRNQPFFIDFEADFSTYL